jgi:hypothetical protein
LTERNAVKFVKKLFGKNDVAEALQRIHRLTLDEVWMTAGEALEVGHGLFQNPRVVTEGEQLPSSC